MFIIFLIFLATPCSADEFSSRARNFSTELTYFTHLHFDNFVLSPFCVWSIMSCVARGAYGTTNTEIQRAFLIGNDGFYDEYKNLTKTIFDSKAKGVAIASKTFVFADVDIIRDIRQVYRAVLSVYYGVQIRVLDLKDAQTSTSVANMYIKNSFPIFENIFHSDDFEDATIIMSNVIGFNGKLTSPFNSKFTFEENVYDEKRRLVGTVTMMRQIAKVPYSNFDSMKAHIMELSYGDDKKFCMLFILPYPGTTASNVFRKLEKITLPEIFNKLQKDVDELGLKDIEVKLPRFRVTTSANLVKPLNDMGVYDAFEPDYARFPKIARQAIYINSIEHKAEISFRETETVATATVPGYSDKTRPTAEYNAEQPFIFFLIEKPTLTILFSGIYSKHNYINEINSRITFNNN